MSGSNLRISHEIGTESNFASRQERLNRPGTELGTERNFASRQKEGLIVQVRQSNVTTLRTDTYKSFFPLRFAGIVKAGIQH